MPWSLSAKEKNQQNTKKKHRSTEKGQLTTTATKCMLRLSKLYTVLFQLQHPFIDVSALLLNGQFGRLWREYTQFENGTFFRRYLEIFLVLFFEYSNLPTKLRLLNTVPVEVYKFDYSIIELLFIFR